MLAKIHSQVLKSNRCDVVGQLARAPVGRKLRYCATRTRLPHASSPLPKHINRNCRATFHYLNPRPCSDPSSTKIMSAAVSTSGVTEVASTDANRRRSGRVIRKPEKLASAPSPSGSAKRKRGDNDDSGVEAGESTSDEQSDSSEGEPDVEELRERQRKRKGKATAKRPATKKPKTNGAPISLAMRPAAGVSRKLTKRPRKAAIRKSAVSEGEPEELYGMP
jgi:hypothetical protein